MRIKFNNWSPRLLLTTAAVATIVVMSSGGVSAASGSGGVAAAKAATAANLRPPTHNSLQTPLKSTPPKGKMVVYMECTDSPACSQTGQGVLQAINVVGWHVKVLTFQSANPATLVDGLNTALQYHPVATIFAALPYATWSSVVPEYKQAGIALLPIGVGPAPVNKTILPQVYGGSAVAQIGTGLGNWTVADSNGHAHVLVLALPAFAVLAPFATSLKATVSSRCSSCSVTVLNATIQEVNNNQINGLIVAALQKDPSVNYFLTPDSAFVTGLAQALAGAGLASRVKVGGESYGNEQIADIKNGSEAAWFGKPLPYFGWIAMDSILRNLEGMKVSANAPIPGQLITKANVNTLKSTAYYEPPFNYQAQFTKAWKEG